MANFYGTARSNYFEVKDEAAFEAAMAKMPDLEVIRKEGLVGIMNSNGDDGCWPSWSFDPENPDEDGEEIDIARCVAEHLVDGAVAIFIQAGAEKHRYISGYAEAINNKFENKVISLYDIYDLAAGLTDSMKEITLAEY